MTCRQIIAICLLFLVAGSWGWGAVGDVEEFSVDRPAYAVSYTADQKAGQREAGRRVIGQINDAIRAGKKQFAVPAGVYRIAGKGPEASIHLWKVNGFRLDLAQTEFILENDGTFVYPVECKDIEIVGPAKLDAEPLGYSEGVVLSHDPANGLTRVKLLPGYPGEVSASGTIDAFSGEGARLQNPSWAKYSGAKPLSPDGRTLELVTGFGDRIYSALYDRGNLVALRGRSANVIPARDVENLTIKDIEIYTGGGFTWGGGSGNWNFLNVRGVRRPGTNRLYGTGGCQVSSHGGDVLFDGCEFSDTTDDLIDYSGGGMFMVVRQVSPHQFITWGGEFGRGDQLRIFAPEEFRPIASPVVRAVSTPAEQGLEREARELVRQRLKARDLADRPLRLVTIDTDVHLDPADICENSSADRPKHFTMRNCYLHDSALRVMVQGFEQGVFEKNRFERISGGLTITCDAWWWEGPTSQFTTIRDNLFIQTTRRDAWGTGVAAIDVGTNRFPAKPEDGTAFKGVFISGNVIRDSSRAAIWVRNASHVQIKDNLIDHPFAASRPAAAIFLGGVIQADIARNVFHDCPDRKVAAEHVSNLTTDVWDAMVDPVANGALPGAK